MNLTKKQLIFTLLILLSITFFTSCEEEKDYSRPVYKEWLTGVKWLVASVIDGDYYENLFVFNPDKSGYFMYTKNDKAEVYSFTWKWDPYNEYHLVMSFVNSTTIYIWDVQTLNEDTLSAYWDESVTGYSVFTVAY